MCADLQKMMKKCMDEKRIERTNDCWRMVVLFVRDIDKTAGETDVPLPFRCMIWIVRWDDALLFEVLRQAERLKRFWAKKNPTALAAMTA